MALSRLYKCGITDFYGEKAASSRHKEWRLWLTVFEAREHAMMVEGGNDCVALIAQVASRESQRGTLIDRSIIPFNVLCKSKTIVGRPGDTWLWPIKRPSVGSLSLYTKSMYSGGCYGSSPIDRLLLSSLLLPLLQNVLDPPYLSTMLLPS